MNTPAGGVTLPEVKACPWCGGKHVVLLHEDDSNCAFVCNAGQGGCGARAPFRRDRDAAIAAWNTRAALAGEWRDVRESLPEPCVPVLLCVESATSGRRYVIRAEYAAPNTMALGDDQEWWEGCTTDEDENIYCPEGWYERNQFDETNWLVSDKAIAWQPLPPPPAAPLPKEPSHG